MTILDTNVVSEITKPEPSSAVVAWATGQMRDQLFTTSITAAEILYGIEVLPRGNRRDQLLHQAEGIFREDLGGRVLSFDERAAREYASIASERRRRGRPISLADGQIAAIARVHGATLATRNTDDFEGCGVKLINPWEGS
jgi:predicted nucleic acid-binding protein